jgi:hypothetical protein
MTLNQVETPQEVNKYIYIFIYLLDLVEST